MPDDRRASPFICGPFNNESNKPTCPPPPMPNTVIPGYLVCARTEVKMTRKQEGDEIPVFFLICKGKHGR